MLSSAFATPSGDCSRTLATIIGHYDLACGSEKFTWIHSIDTEQWRDEQLGVHCLRPSCKVVYLAGLHRFQ